MFSCHWQRHGKLIPTHAFQVPACIKFTNHMTKPSVKGQGILHYSQLEGSGKVMDSGRVEN